MKKTAFFYRNYRARRWRIYRPMPGAWYCKSGWFCGRCKEKPDRSDRMFFETASEAEIKERFHDEVFITRLEVAVE